MSLDGAATKKYYFEDFIVGSITEIPGPTFTKESIFEYARRYDPQSFHVDEEAAKHSIYGGLLASGWQTVSLCMRMVCDAYLLDSASMGSPGVKEIRWTKPVRAGDTITLRLTVLEAKPSSSKPDRGTVLHRWEVFNQHRALVMHMEGYGMFQRRSAAEGR